MKACYLANLVTVTSQELNTQTNLESIIGPLITEVKFLHESVHSDYKESKNCMSIQKTELGKLEESILTSQQECKSPLTCKIEKNSEDIQALVNKNRKLRKENTNLKE